MKIQNDKGIIDSGPMMNAYPDSMGGRLDDIVRFLKSEEVKGAFQSFYILPSVFNSDLDRGFSVIDYDLNQKYASISDLEELKKMGVGLKFDFVLNHSSVQSAQFQDVIRNGENSEYADFFIQWNKFWEGYGELTEEGYIQPNQEYIKDMFFRKPGLPILNVRMPDGKEVPYWNTFYQEIKYAKLDPLEVMRVMEVRYNTAVMLTEFVNSSITAGKKPLEIEFGDLEDCKDKTIEMLESGRSYLGQMDLNIKSPMVWAFYEDTLQKLFGYGAEIVRLDAFAYAPKEPGMPNFLNDPGTWDLLEKVKVLADKYNLTLLPEIHSKYEDKIHEKLSGKGYLTYDFFLPGLIIDALERKTNEVLLRWINDIISKKMKLVNMLGCHDGIPLLDLKGLLTDEQIENLIQIVVKRGGYVKDLHGQKNMYYQVNATYYSALGENDTKLLLARAIQLFMPGKPQVWYLDLLAGINDYDAVKRAGEGGHKEINRTNLSKAEVIEGLNKEVVKKQLSLLEFRNNFHAFGFDADLKMIDSEAYKLKFMWEKDGYKALLLVDLSNYSFLVEGIDDKNNLVYCMKEG